EAAGILKHRQRKDRAIRRLERTDADVLRLQDIVGELTRQIRPLKRQAKAAEEHAGLVATVRDLRLYLGGERLRHLDGRAAGLSEERTRLSVEIAEGQVEVAELASALGILSAEAGEVGEALDRDSAAAARLETTLERLRRSASVAHERHRAAVARRDGADERRRDLEEERHSLQAELAGVVHDVGEAEVAADRLERQYRALEDEDRSLADQEMLTPEGALAVVRGEVRALEGTGQRDARELDQVRRRREVVEAQIADEEAEADRLNEEIRALDSAAAEAQSAYERAAQRRRQVQERWETIETSLNEARLSVASAQARREAVAQAVEGAADPEARRLVANASGHRGSLTGLLDVPAEWAAAVRSEEHTSEL